MNSVKVPRSEYQDNRRRETNLCIAIEMMLDKDNPRHAI